MARWRIVAAAGIVAVAAGSLAWWQHDPRYLGAGELDHAPYPLRRIDLDPPQAAGGVEYYGKLVFDLYIGRSGRVDRVEMREATLPSEIGERFVAAFREARWQPGRKAGREVRSVKRVEVVLEPPPGAARAPMRPDS